MRDEPRSPPAQANEEIAELMAHPVRGFASIIVIGDDAVAGVTPLAADSDPND